MFSWSPFWPILLSGLFFLLSIAQETSILAEVIQEPTRAWLTLGASIPRQALYFANYIILEGFGKIHQYRNLILQLVIPASSCVDLMSS